MKLPLADRLWLAWRVLRGLVVDYRADAVSTHVTLDLTARDRQGALRRLQRLDEAKRAERRRPSS